MTDIYNLYLSQTETDPAEAPFTVMTEDQFTIPQLETLGEFLIIGSSHYIKLDSINYYELFSYEDYLHQKPVTEINLHSIDPTQSEQTKNWARTITTNQETYSVSTNVTVHSLSTFPQDRDFHLVYKFDSLAYTAISILQDGFETYHTYPEKDITVYTKTVFE